MIVRQDLPHGFQAAQIVHAAGSTGSLELPINTNAVVLSVPAEQHLRLIAKHLGISGIPHVCICEVDPPYDGQLTAIGILPLTDRTKIKKLLSSLPLLGQEKCSNTSLPVGSKPSRAPYLDSSTAEHQE